jgi:hypothetical protein
MAYTRKVNFSATNRYGCGPADEDDVYTVEEFAQLVRDAMFIDYDGFGYPVKDSVADPSIIVRPSSFRQSLPEDATHIIGFNR